MAQIKWLRQSIFPARFGVTSDYDDYVKIITRMKAATVDEPENQLFGMSTSVVYGKDAKHYVLLWFNVKKHKTIGELINTVAHECTHAWQAVRVHIGEESPGDETEAYVIGWLTEQVLKVIVPELCKYKTEELRCKKQQSSLSENSLDEGTIN